MGPARKKQILRAYNTYRAVKKVSQMVRSNRAKRVNQKKRSFSGVKTLAPVYSSGRMTYSRTTKTLKKRKGYNLTQKKPDIHTIVSSGGEVSVVGQQAVKAVSLLGTSGDWKTAFDTSYATSGGVYTGIVTNTSKDRSIWIDSTKSVITFTNQGPSLMELDIYDYKCRDDFTPGVDTLLAFGVDDMEGTNASGAAPQFLGTTPQMSQRVRRSWSLLRKSSVHMASGSIHRHTVSHNTNKPVNIQTSESGDSMTLRGWTIQTIVIFKGTPADTAQGLAVGSVSVCPAKLIWTTENTIRSRQMEYKARTLTQAGGFNVAVAAPMTIQNPRGLGIADVGTGGVNPNQAYA